VQPRPENQTHRRRPPARSGRPALLLALGVALASSAPLYYGRLGQNEQAVFLWGGAYPPDTNQYFAFLRTGYRGDWLTTNLFTSSGHAPVALFPIHVALGHAARLYADLLASASGRAPSAVETIPVVYHAARFALVIALMLAIHRLARQWTARPAIALWIVALAAFAGGWSRDPNAETSVFRSCARNANFVWSLICHVIVCGAYLDAIGRKTGPRWRRGAAVAACGLILGWEHPFDVPPVAAAGAAALVWRWMAERRFPLRLCALTVAFLGGAAPPILYMAWLSRAVDVFRIVSSQNVLSWCYSLEWVAMLDASLVVAVVGMGFLWKRRRRQANVFLILWIVTGLVVTSLPLRFNRRMIEGLPILLAFALAAAVEGALVRPLAARAVRRWRLLRGGAVFGVRASIRRRRHLAYAVTLVALLPKTLFLCYDEAIGIYRPLKDYFYLYRVELEALEWLEAHSDWREVVWADVYRGNTIPFISGHRVYCGHSVLTDHFETRREQTRRLFARELPVAEFRKIVRDSGIRYVYYGVRERSYDPLRRDFVSYDPQTLGTPVFRNDAVHIFRMGNGNDRQERAGQ